MGPVCLWPWSQPGRQRSRMIWPTRVSQSGVFSLPTFSVRIFPSGPNKPERSLLSSSRTSAVLLSSCRLHPAARPTFSAAAASNTLEQTRVKLGVQPRSKAADWTGWEQSQLEEWFEGGSGRPGLCLGKLRPTPAAVTLGQMLRNVKTLTRPPTITAPTAFTCRCRGSVLENVSSATECVCQRLSTSVLTE